MKEEKQIYSNHYSGTHCRRRPRMTTERDLTVIHLDEKLNWETLRFFQKRESKGTIVVACANVVVMRRFAIATIFSFHRFYTRQKRIQTPIATNSRGGGERR